MQRVADVPQPVADSLQRTATLGDRRAAQSDSDPARSRRAARL